jgi:Adenylate and Guanylate cyclase catalytic domain
MSLIPVETGCKYAHISNICNSKLYLLSSSLSISGEAIAFQEILGLNAFVPNSTASEGVSADDSTRNNIVYYNREDESEVDPGHGPYLPSWISSPFVNVAINENLFQDVNIGRDAEDCIENENILIGRFEFAPAGTSRDPNKLTSLFGTLISMQEREEATYLGDPMARLYVPIFDSFEKNRTVVAVMIAIIHWKEYMRDILPHQFNGIIAVLENQCGGSFTYEINGHDADLVGVGDLHDPEFNDYGRTTSNEGFDVVEDGTTNPLLMDTDECLYYLHVYPSRVSFPRQRKGNCTHIYLTSILLIGCQTFYNDNHTDSPLRITLGITLVFFVTIALFLLYDRLVERRQRIVIEKAAQSTAIVTSLFPKQVCERLLAEDEQGLHSGKMGSSSKNKLKAFLTNGAEGQALHQTQFAELFPHCTVLFADIAGFTAWSSTREPELVFVLLQTVFSGFDSIAKRRKVFKVETIGDCYVAVAGLPEAQPNHATIMARFAWECKNKMTEMTRGLEVTLGPDCSDLTMRFGKSNKYIVFEKFQFRQLVSC